MIVKLLKTRENQTILKGGDDKTQISYKELAFGTAADFPPTNVPRGAEYLKWMQRITQRNSQ